MRLLCVSSCQGLRWWRSFLAISPIWTMPSRRRRRQMRLVIPFLTFQTILRSAYRLGIHGHMLYRPQRERRTCRMPTNYQPPEELEAFCHSCPKPQEVITFLAQLGLRLDFQMEA